MKELAVCCVFGGISFKAIKVTKFYLCLHVFHITCSYNVDSIKL